MELKSITQSENMIQLVEKFKNQKWNNKSFYSQWLAQSYYYTTYSTRMLAFAAGWTQNMDQSYYRRSLKHISEEQGHDLIALNDLKNLGETIQNYSEKGTTRALWECQFYKIQKDPTQLLGYILALEVLAVKTFKELHYEILKFYPEVATKFIKVHADDDPDHVEQALAEINKCSPEQQDRILQNFNQTITMYQFMLEEINH